MKIIMIPIYKRD